MIIKLKDVLCEYFHKNSCLNSWLNPSGEFLPNNGRNHANNAMDILSDKDLDKDFNDLDPMDHLFKLKWQRVIQGITSDGYRCLYSTNPYMMPNQKQKQELIDLCKELEIRNLFYDNEKSHQSRYDNLIWSFNNEL